MQGIENIDFSALPEEARAVVLKKVVEPLWRRGNLDFLLDETQLKIQHAIRENPSRQFYLLCSRRLGKSYILVKTAFELCYKKPGARIQYLAPEGKDAADIVTDIADVILSTCPDDLKPKYNSQEKTYTFTNGSIIRFKGVNGEKHERIRGGASDLVVLDECGVMDDLDYIVRSIVRPMVMTTNGRILLATTPPRSPGHDSATIYGNLLGRGATVKYTILDNHRIPYEAKVEALQDAGEDIEDIPDILAGRRSAKSTTALREYFCEFVTDAETAVIPEMAAAKKDIVRAFPNPPYFDAYVAIDPGFNDRTALLFGFWDFRRAKLCIRKSKLLHQASTLDIADTIKATEAELWGEKPPFRRVSDVDPRLVKDLWELHGLYFQQAEKQDSLGAINLVRTMVQMREIEIDPECHDLIWQMQAATWNRKATDFERTKEDGHFDLVAALKYLCRSIDRSRNPFPAHSDTGADGHFISPKLARKQEALKPSLAGLVADTPFTRRMQKKRGFQR